MDELTIVTALAVAACAYGEKEKGVDRTPAPKNKQKKIKKTMIYTLKQLLLHFPHLLRKHNRRCSEPFRKYHTVPSQFKELKEHDRLMAA